MTRKKSKNAHYVNNQEFSENIVEYVKTVNSARDAGKDLPIVPNYLAKCFLNIAENLSHKSNFIRYTYREEMVMDAVENCLRAIENYNIEAATRTGKPNAFAYFTQISWYAFLRRIAKEKKQQDIKYKYMTSSGVEAFMSIDMSEEFSKLVGTNYVDILKDRIEKVKEADAVVKDLVKSEKKRKKREVKVDSDLSEFLSDKD